MPTNPEFNVWAAGDLGGFGAHSFVCRLSQFLKALILNFTTLKSKN